MVSSVLCGVVVGTLSFFGDREEYDGEDREMVFSIFEVFV